MNIKFFLATLVFSIVVIACIPANKETKADKIITKQSIQKRDNMAVLTAANSPDQIYSKAEIPILCYHRIALGMKSDYEISPATFSSHMKVLADSGYHSISPAQLYDYLVFNKSLPEKPVMITFDDSRIEHWEIAAPVMEKYGFRGVFFIMTITLNKKKYMTAEQIAQLAKNGHTVGLHSWDHVMVTKYKSEGDWKKELTDPKVKLEKIINRPIEYWAYPDGVYNHQSAEELSIYLRISFILASPRDPLLPLQTVRRMIVPERSPEKLLKSMRATFGSHDNSQKKLANVSHR